ISTRPRGSEASTICSTIYANRSAKVSSHLAAQVARYKVGAQYRLRLSRGVKDILVTGITVTTLFTSVATASAQNIFEALFGRLAPAPGPVPNANFTARDRQQLAHPPYQQAWIPPAYRLQVVRYHRQEAPGTILVETDAR